MDSTSRPFRNLDDQLMGLEARGMTIDDRDYATKVLLNNNYYSVINGYKLPFLKKDSQGKVLKPEIFLPDTRFSEVYSLFCMDEELRNIILEYLLTFESRLRSIIAYRFSNACKGRYSYLEISNYRQDAKSLSIVLKNISNLSYKLNKYGKAKFNNPVKHYITKHEDVPLWVLVNYLTFGETQYLFDSLDDNLKQRVARDFSEYYKDTVKSNEKIDVEELHIIIACSNLFRNVCAHEERLYNYQIHQRLRLTELNKYFVNNSNIPQESANLFTMVSMLMIILKHRESKELVRQLDHTFGKHQRKWKSIKIINIYELMGFGESWKDDLLLKSE